MDKTDVYTIYTDVRVIDFARKHPFPGWYIDIDGYYCCIIGRYLISIFVNDCDNTMDIAVDAVSGTGKFDQNIEWVTPLTDAELAETAMRFTAQYAREGAPTWK